MKIKFLKDFRGKETKEIYYLKDTVLELDDDIAAKRLVSFGFAEQVIEKEPEKPKTKK